MTIDQKKNVLEPASEEEASQILQECSRNGRTVKIVGGGTKLDLGNPYAETDVIISTLKLDKLIDYQPEDLTITVGAGMTFARLQEILAEQGQMLPLDPPDLEGQTLGGVLATNRSGPRRLLYGTARDLLIGCRFVLADGSIGHSGGKVVKNVAGYDLHKLFIGSYGTLGLLTEVTFKVVPIPQVAGIGAATFASVESAFLAARQCVRSNLMPCALEVTNGAEKENHILFYGADGTETAVKGQLDGLAQICTNAGATLMDLGETKYQGTSFWLVITSILGIHGSTSNSSILLKVSSVLTHLPRVYQLLEILVENENFWMSTIKGRGGDLFARAGTGLIHLGPVIQSDNPDPAQLKVIATLIEKARAEVQKMGGSLVIERAPQELKKLVDAWGDFGDALPSMQALKKKLDPQGLLNPGVMDLK